jgi:hypothetical protein
MTDLQETHHESFRLPSNKDIPVWRYMDLSKYLSMLHHRALFFVRANLLGDPFEGSSTAAMVAAREHIKQNRATDPALASWKDIPEATFSQMSLIFKNAVDKHLISCWHMNEHESAAMWKLYSTSDEAVCVQSTYRRLRQCLPQCVFVGEVKYINYQTEGFPPWNGFHYIMHKRASFAHERELRAIFWEPDGSPEAQPYKKQIVPSGLTIEVDLPALIERVYVSPSAAPWLADLVSAMTTKCGYAFQVNQSALAATPLY